MQKATMNLGICITIKQPYFYTEHFYLFIVFTYIFTYINQLQYIVPVMLLTAMDSCYKLTMAMWNIKYRKLEQRL